MDRPMIPERRKPACDGAMTGMPPGGATASMNRSESALEDEGPRWIRCRRCRAEITAPEFGVRVQGVHRHVFANPMGVVFEVGCFSRVHELGYVGPQTDEFSWFHGFRWRIAVCGRCQVHLGWHFTSAVRSGFHALIIDRLLFPGDP